MCDRDTEPCHRAMSGGGRDVERPPFHVCLAAKRPSAGLGWLLRNGVARSKLECRSIIKALQA
jgi:hypothetical protein